MQLNQERVLYFLSELRSSGDDELFVESGADFLQDGFLVQVYVFVLGADSLYHLVVCIDFGVELSQVCLLGVGFNREAVDRFFGVTLLFGGPCEAEVDGHLFFDDVKAFTGAHVEFFFSLSTPARAVDVKGLNVLHILVRIGAFDFVADVAILNSLLDFFGGEGKLKTLDLFAENFRNEIERGVVDSLREGLCLCLHTFDFIVDSFDFLLHDNFQ